MSDAVAYLGETIPPDLEEGTVPGEDLHVVEPSDLEDIRDRIVSRTSSLGCIIVDRQLGSPDPVVVVSTLRAETAVPIVVLDREGSEEFRERAIAAGATDYVSLTDDGWSLREAVDRLVESDGSPDPALTRGARYTHLVESNVIGIYELREDRFSYVNPRFAEMFGYERSELIGTSAFDVIHADEHATLRENMERLRDGDLDRIRTEYTGVRNDGETVVVEAHGTLLREEPAPVFCGYALDVTEQKQRERRFETVFDNTFQFTGLLAPDGTVLEANDTALAFGGLTAEEVLGERLWETPWVANNAAGRESVKEAVETARSGDQYRDELEVSGESDTVIVDFSVRAVTNETGEVTQLIAEGRDITALKKSEQRRKTIIEQVTDAVVEMDEDWRFSLVDDRAAEIYDIPESELLGEYFWDVFEWGVGTVFEETYRRVMETREPESMTARYDGLEDASGLEGWFEVHIYPRPDGGLSFYFRDVTDRKRREERASGLNDLLATLIETETAQDVADEVVASAANGLHLPYTAFALFDDENSLTMSAATTAANENLASAILLEQGSGAGWEAFVNSERAVLTPPLEAAAPGTGDLEELVVHPLGRHGVLLTGGEDHDREFSATVAENIRTTLDRIQSEDLLRQREDRLTEQNEELNRLQRVNEIIRTIDQALVGATDRREIREAVCEELTQAETYAFAWFGSHDTASSRIEARTWAGEGQGYLDSVEFSTGGDRGDLAPEEAAVRSGTHQVVHDILGDPPFDEWRQASLNRGFRSVIAIPIQYDGSMYGVLSLAATEPGVFDGLEGEVLTEFGDTIGHAINAVERKRALVSDTVLDLKLRIDPADNPLVSFVQADEARSVDLNGVVPTDSGLFRVFATFHGERRETVVDLLDRITEVSSYDLIGSHDGGIQTELLAGDESLIHWLLDRGAIPVALEVTGDGGLLQVQLYGDARLREFVEQFQHAYPNSELVASRERERTVRSRDEFREAFESALSDRQREVLKTAYLSGYFESPRGRNATEIAAAMDIAQPTFSTHVRSGLDNLFGLIFDEESTRRS